MKNFNNISLRSQLHQSPSQSLVCEAELFCSYVKEVNKK
jgi:hypothetical protein